MWQVELRMDLQLQYGGRQVQPQWLRWQRSCASAMRQLEATARAPHMLLQYLAQSLHAHGASCQCKACAGAGPAPVCSGSCGGSYWGAGHAAVAAGSHAGSLPGAASYRKRAVLAEL